MAQATTNITDGQIRSYQGPPFLIAGTLVVQGASDALIALPTAAGQQVIGSITETDLVGAGEYGVKRFGEAYILCGSALAAPAYFKADANGHAVPSTAAGDLVAGYAISSTVNPGDEFVGFLNGFIR